MSNPKPEMRIEPVGRFPWRWEVTWSTIPELDGNGWAGYSQVIWTLHRAVRFARRIEADLDCTLPTRVIP